MFNFREEMTENEEVSALVDQCTTQDFSTQQEISELCIQLARYCAKAMNISAKEELEHWRGNALTQLQYLSLLAEDLFNEVNPILSYIKNASYWIQYPQSYYDLINSRKKHSPISLAVRNIMTARRSLN